MMERTKVKNLKNRTNDAYLDHTVLTRQYKYLYIKPNCLNKTMNWQCDEKEIVNKINKKKETQQTHSHAQR